MKIYNKDKTKEFLLTEIDENLGRLEHHNDTIHHEEVLEKKEKGHYEIIGEYANGGKDMKWVVEEPGVPYQAAYDEPDEYYIYIPYSQEYLHNREVNLEIDAIKKELSESDYKILKRFEGYYTDEEFELIKQERKTMRDRINELESQLYEIVPEEQEGII